MVWCCIAAHLAVAGCGRVGQVTSPRAPAHPQLSWPGVRTRSGAGLGGSRARAPAPALECVDWTACCREPGAPVRGGGLQGHVGPPRPAPPWQRALPPALPLLPSKTSQSTFFSRGCSSCPSPPHPLFPCCRRCRPAWLGSVSSAGLLRSPASRLAKARRGAARHRLAGGGVGAGWSVSWREDGCWQVR